MRYGRLRGEESVNMAYRNHPRVIRISGTGPYGVDGTYEFVTEMPEK